MIQAPAFATRGGIRLGFVGDLILGRHVSAKLVDGFPPADMWGDIRPHMLAVDAMIGNLEGPITTHSQRWRLPKAFYFRADPKAVDALTAGNFRCVALANNHMLDFQAQGIADTRRYLDEAGIAYAGAGANTDEAAALTVFDVGNHRIGFVSITNTVPAFAAKSNRAGTNHWGIRASRANRERLADHIAELRGRGADLLILSIHWGPNYRWWPLRRYRNFAKAAIDLGFDIVHGHSAHILQATEFHGHGVILYDTGDYIHDFDPVDGILARIGIPNHHGFMFEIDLAADGRPTLRMIPAELGVGTANVARPELARTIIDRMIRRCRGYAIDLALEDNVLIGRPPQAHTIPPGAEATSPSASSTANSRNR